MKKKLLMIVMAMVLCFALAACGGGGDKEKDDGIDPNATVTKEQYDKLFYPQIGVKPCSMAGGGVSKNIWNCFRTAPEGTGQPLTCSTSGMGLRLK